MCCLPLTSNDPEATKLSSLMLSPFLKMKSPGALWIMSNPTARDRRQPSDASRNAGQSLNTRLKNTETTYLTLHSGALDAVGPVGQIYG